MIDRAYYIVSPPYAHCCGGIRALHELNRLLGERGLVSMLSCDAPHIPAWRDNAVVVYPEIVKGNPLGFRHVARWDLYFPAHQYTANEVVFAFDELYRARGSQAPPENILGMVLAEEFFREAVSGQSSVVSGGRTKRCFWRGKGAATPLVAETAGCIEITTAWPATRLELAKLFQESEVFYSYDNFTALIAEARLCGCPVVLIPSAQIRPDQWLSKHGSLGVIFLGDGRTLDDARRTLPEFRSRWLAFKGEASRQLDHFIEVTQRADRPYIEDVQPVPEGWRGWVR